MIVYSDGSGKYRCSTPSEIRANINHVGYQWMLEFIAYDATSDDIDSLLGGVLYFCDENTGNITAYSGYKNINNVNIRYSEDLSPIALVQLAKDIVII